MKIFLELLEHGSDRRETLPKRVSNDFGRFVFRRRKKKMTKILDRKFRFLPIWRDFGGATAERTSKSAGPSNFALDRLIERSVRPKNLGFSENLGSSQNFRRVESVRFPSGIK